MSDEAIEIFNAKVAKLTEELAPHSEARCECHQQRNCLCYQEYTPLGMDQLYVEGWHCSPDFVLSCELADLRM